MKKVLASILIFSMLFISATYADMKIPEGFVKVTEDCYLEPSINSEGKMTNYGTLHFRGKNYGEPAYVMDIYSAASAIEGIQQVYPNPYTWTILKGTLYSWDEIISKIASVLQNAKKMIESKASEEAKKKGF